MCVWGGGVWNEGTSYDKSSTDRLSGCDVAKSLYLVWRNPDQSPHTSLNAAIIRLFKMGFGVRKQDIRGRCCGRLSRMAGTLWIQGQEIGRCRYFGLRIRRHG